jgi:hypothetical protein
VERSFLERQRNTIIGIAVVAALAVVGAFVFASATSPVYACSAEFQPPASADPSHQGAVEDDLGRGHVQAGNFVRYTLCPPASGQHYTAAGQGPIQSRLYGPNDQAVPQGWIHNLEHGGLVVLYRCTGSDTACGDSAQSTMKSFVDAFPASPICGLRPGSVSPVVARFDQMPKPYAAIVWGRVLYLDSFDASAILDFFKQEGERTNPEPQCAAPSASPSAGASASPGTATSPVASPGASGSPSTQPSAPSAVSPSPS